MTPESNGGTRAEVSHIYLRLLRGEVTPARYVAVMRRAVRMRRRKGRLKVGLFSGSRWIP